MTEATTLAILATTLAISDADGWNGFVTKASYENGSSHK
jgi:hypothetical protein